jgi:hypothetical protein
MGFPLFRTGNHRRTIHGEVEPYRIDATDRAWFKQCRRAWDLGARARRGLEPAAGGPTPPWTPIVDALAVYYFPGMWDWDRDVVQRLVHQGLDRSGGSLDRTAAHALLDRYAVWARPRDRFTPVRVAAELEVNVPDPFLSDRDLATPEGAPVRYVTTADAVVWGADDRLQLLCHRVGSGPFTDPEVLALDEPALTACWTWAHLMLDDRIAAIGFNEIRVDQPDGFRRTEITVTPDTIARAGRQLGSEVLDMLDAGLSLYPNPTTEGCGTCAFRIPCRAMREGMQAEPLLAAAYRRRPDPVLQEGRLGGQTWSTSRGARPPFTTGEQQWPPDRR